VASESDLISKIRQALAQYDDDSLVAIANKGMVRRARKDLQSNIVKGILAAGISDCDLAWVRLQVAAYEVEISTLGVTKATCNCAAVEVCRHILAASMWLRAGAMSAELAAQGLEVSSAVNEPAAIAPTNPGPKSEHARNVQPGSNARPSSRFESQKEPQTTSQSCSELLDFSAAQLKKWAGKKDYEAAIAMLANSPTVEIGEGSPVVIKLPDFKVECRYFLGAGLDGMICSRRSPQLNCYLILAVLAYQQKHGITQESNLPETIQVKNDSSLVQVELLQQMVQLFAEAVGMGVCNLSSVVQQRFISLSVSASGANLPRLAKSLRAIADQIDLLAVRSAQADESRLFKELAKADAIANATLQLVTNNRLPPVSLVGQHRSKYEEVGDLNLVGMGAFHWESKTGYAGVTILFWETEIKKWFCWSEVRPTFRGIGFSPWWRYKQSDVWDQSPEMLSQHTFKLISARRNYQNRLSASLQSKVMIQGKAEPVKLDFGDRYFKSWSDLRNYAARVIRTGLSEYYLLQSMVIISPATWGDREYDEVNQMFNWWLADLDGDLLPLRVQYRPSEEGRIRFLETLVPEEYWVWGIIGQLAIAGDGISLYPISLLCQPPDDALANQQNDKQPEEQENKKNNKQRRKNEPEYRTIINLSFINKKYAKFSDSNDRSQENKQSEELNDIAAIEDVDLEITPLDLCVDQLLEHLQHLAEHGGLVDAEMQRELSGGSKLIR
jgi:hypothetical protein